MQLISHLTAAQIDRPKNMDMTSLGAAFLAGLAVGRVLTCHDSVIMCLFWNDERKYQETS